MSTFHKLQCKKSYSLHIKGLFYFVQTEEIEESDAMTRYPKDQALPCRVVLTLQSLGKVKDTWIVARPASPLAVSLREVYAWLLCVEEGGGGVFPYIS